MTALLNPKSSEKKRSFFWGMIIVVYLGAMGFLLNVR